MSNDLFAGIGVVPGTFLLPRPDADWTANRSTGNG